MTNKIQLLTTIGTPEHPNIINFNQIALAEELKLENYINIYIKINDTIDLCFLSHNDNLNQKKLHIFSDDDELIFKNIYIKNNKNNLYENFSEITIHKPIKNITKLLNLNQSKSQKNISIKIKSKFEHSFTIENTFNLPYEKHWIFASKENNQITLKINDSNDVHSLNTINNHFDELSIEVFTQDEFLELKQIDIDSQKIELLKERLILNKRNPFFPILFENLDLKIESNLFKKDTTYLPYFYINKCKCTINTKHNLIFNIIFESSSLNTIDEKPFNFDCHLVDLSTYEKIEDKHKFLEIEKRYLLGDINFVTHKKNIFPNFFKSILNPLYSPTSFSNVSSYIIALIFLFIFNSVMFEQKDMMPTKPASIQAENKDSLIQSTESWAYLDGYQQYNPFVYALELALPINIGLGVAEHWMPIFDEERRHMNLYYYISKFMSFILWFLVAFNLLKFWSIKNESK